MSRHEELVIIGREVVQDAPQLYLDTDVETDGKAGYGSLRALGSVSPWGDEFYAEIKPFSNRYVEEQHQFCEEHGLQRERLFREGQELSIVMHGFVKWAKEIVDNHHKTRPIIVARNASFDYPWIDLACLESGIMNEPFGKAGYCIKSLGKVFTKGYDWQDTSKRRIPPELTPPGDFTHHALEDSRYQQQEHFAMVGKLRTLGLI